jgi:DEAD/DEAH box helicase domain-containing protein
MLPLLTARDIEQGLRQFLKATFPITTPGFQRDGDGSMVEDFLAVEGSFLKGPWLEVKLPFRAIGSEEEIPLQRIKLPYPPYRHQQLAFERLCGAVRLSTIVATGTGSGKTECFMYPLLDYCLANPGQGIKAIIIYPMNALATDQARRFAKEVSKLDTKLNVGLFTGDDGSDSRVMTPEQIITHQDTLRQNPPDILLTNYKMLDFLLMRPKDQKLWRFNKPGMLRFLVVDELHSFDGAQGTDLACLIRRLRDKLKIGSELACVGTSATIGDVSAKESLRKYAEEVFAADFDDESIVLEDRLSVEEYLAQQSVDQPLSQWPVAHVGELQPGVREQGVHLRQLANLWLGKDLPLDATDIAVRNKACVELAGLLHSHTAFHALLHDASSLVNVTELAAKWQQKWALDDLQKALVLLESLCTLISAARLWQNEKENQTTHFLLVRVHLWLREWRRMVASVAAQPVLVHADDLMNPADPLHLPVMHCRECHAAAWGAVQSKGEQLIKPDVQTFYNAWFSEHPDSCLLYPVTDGERRRQDGEYKQLCAACLHLKPAGAEACPDCQRNMLLVWVPNLRKEVTRNGEPVIKTSSDCPCCGGTKALSILGSRAASLASVAIGSLCGSEFNDDHKLIAFSDSVQDAAHRAGFFGARNFNQVTRHAIANVVRGIGEGMALSRLIDEVPAYWQRKLETGERFVGTFIAPTMEWRAAYQHLVEQGELTPGSDLPSLIAKRLRWETLCEFGLRSRIGRTLERTATATVYPEQSGLQTAARELMKRLQEELGQLKQITEQQVLLFLLGVLTRLRQQGAFYDPALDLYVADRGNTYLLSRQSFMPGYGPRNRPPAALTREYVSPFFETLRSNQSGWYLGWFNKSLAQDQPLSTAEFEQAYNLTLAVLERAGLLRSVAAGQDEAWLLQPDRWLVTARVAELACADCGHRLPAAAGQMKLWNHLPCLRHGCLGHYQLNQLPGNELAYRAAPQRLVTSEHTGLMEGVKRYAVEQSFIDGKNPWDVNLLSATPTLEMGINIGDLSSVLLCSVPPAQANYLQRIGRAGRQDGNSLALTIANGRPHDLYFYAEPLEMLAGQVATPGVFLQAMAVLERQLIAYCFDRWVATGVDDSAIPGQMQPVLNNIESNRQQGFPYNLLGFIEEHTNTLLADFLKMFPDLDDDGKLHLENAIADHKNEGTLGWRILNRLKELVDSRSSHLYRAKELKKIADLLEQRPEDEERNLQLKASRDERNALLALVRDMNKRHTLNFFTDEGLLPNYAFPEEGVTLNSVILRRREQRETASDEINENKQKYETLSFSFQRSAQAALGELAPENRFYAAAHQLQIEQVDLKLSKPEEWRLCNQCHHSQNITQAIQHHSVCPRCGSPQWADVGQKRTLLRLRQVYARADSRFDRIGDDSDQREPAFFKRQLLVDIPPGSTASAYRLDTDELPFGFEFLRAATFREINFGKQGVDADAFEVAGRRESRKGFQICKHCGMVKRHRLRKGQFAHALDCPLSRPNAEEKDSDWLNSLYLYRELTSEAVRILLPLADVAYSEKARHSLVAALNMGLKQYFHGDVNHLEITEMLEPVAGNGSGKQYLVIYDRIPGGTGYLKELMRDPKNLLGMLDMAYQTLSRCSCVQDEKRDGCYRCILAYRDSRNMSVISRQIASSLLGRILQNAEKLVQVDGLSDIKTNSMLESELEQRFITALEKSFNVLKKTVNGKPGYSINANGFIWEIEPQVEFGPAQGCVLNTRADFVIRPLRESERAGREIVIYTDGFGFHCDKLTDDTRKRQSLIMAGKLVFVLGWDDLPESGRAPPIAATDVLLASRNPLMLQRYDVMAEANAWQHSAALSSFLTVGTYRWLERWLEKPDEAAAIMQQACLANLLGWLNPAAARAPHREPCLQEIEMLVPSVLMPDIASGKDAWGGLLASLDQALIPVSLFCRIPIEAMQSVSRLVSEAEIHLNIDDTKAEHTKAFSQQWRGFWQAFNLLQFAPRFTVTTRTGVVQHGYDSALHCWPQRGEPLQLDAGEQEEWHAIAAETLLDPVSLASLREANLPLPEVGADLMVDGEIIATAEMAWPDCQVALFMEIEEKMPVITDWQLISFQSSDWLARLCHALDVNKGN